MNYINFFIVCLFTLQYSFAQNNSEYAPNQVIVQPKQHYAKKLNSDPLSFFNAKEVKRLNTYHKLKEIKPIGNNSLNIYLLTFLSSNVIEIVEDYTKTGVFDFVEPNYIASGGGKRDTIFPNDEYFSRQFYLYNDGSFSLSPAVEDADIDMELAWDIQQGDSSIVAAILDSGVKLRHPEVLDRIWANPNETINDMDDDGNGYKDDTRGWDFVNDDNTPRDDHGHGSNVTGIIGAEGNNDIGYAGVDWNCKLMICKVLNEENRGSQSSFIEAIIYAVDNGAHIINMSLGGTSYSAIYHNAVKYAYDNNVAIIACMMNENTSIPFYPAAFPETIAVGSTNANDTRSVPFFWDSETGSNFGEHIDIVAPGNYIYGLNHRTNTNYNSYWGGTSQSAPMVTGVGSLLLAQDPTRSPEDLRSIINSTAEDLVGFPEEDTDGFDIYYGYGRLNAYKALSKGLMMLSVDCAGEDGGSATVGTTCTDEGGATGTYDDDCNCIVDVVAGCMDENACNYNSAATEGDESCIYPVSENVDCFGNCIVYSDCAGECGGSANTGAACDDGNPETENDAYGADCICAGTLVMTGSQGGTLSISNGGYYGSMNYLNDGASITVAASDFTLVQGQVIHYVFHEDGEVTSGSPLSNVLQVGSSFTNNGLGKKEIYVTAFGAAIAATGEPDFSDPNITYSNTLPIILLRPITIVNDETCDELSAQFIFTINITGGLPECVSTTQFSISGDYFTGTLGHGESQSVGPIEDAENYVVSVFDENGGNNSISKAVNCSKLPAELISFKGEALEQGSMLKWTTATEINNEFFTIETSNNGIDFKQLTILKGQGNTSSTSSYNYLDRTANNGLTYYRLNQTDFDGTTVVLAIISIERGETSLNISDVFPIPTSGFVNIGFMASEQSLVDVEIYDLVGNTIEMHAITSLGNNLLKLNVADYPAGIYFVLIISNENKAIQKFVVE